MEIKTFGAVSESTLSNEVGIIKVLIAAYSLLDGGGDTGGGFRGGLSYLRGGDDARIGTNSGVSSYDGFLFDSNDGYIHNKWRFLYAAVGRCNDVLKLLPKVEDSTPEKLLQIEAEAKFCRAVNYLYLAILFKNVPWIDETVNYTEGNYFVPNTVDIYPKIEEDFKFAADNLTDTKGDVGRANKWAAKSFLAKTYMFQHKFNEAKALFDDIIPNGQTSNGLKYELLEQYNHNFITRTKHGSEAVFTVQMSVNDGSSGGNGNQLDHYNGTFGGPATCCYGWLQGTFDYVDANQTDPATGLPLLDTYQDNPIPSDNGLASSDAFTPYAGTLDSRLDWCIGRRGIPYRDWGVHPGYAWIRKQFTSGPYSCIKNICESARVATDRSSGGGYTSNAFNLIRFADVLLWAAECEVEIGSLPKAEEYTNIVRARAADPVTFVKTYIDDGTPLGGFTDIPAANYYVGLYTGEFAANGQSYARKAVRFERRLEFGLEHHRFFDCVRYDGIEFDCAAEHNAFMAREAPRISNPDNNYWIGIYVKNKNELLPIPLQQIDLSVETAGGSSVLVQNPGY